MGEGVEDTAEYEVEGEEEARPDETALTLGLRLRWIGYAAFLASVGVSAAAYGYASVADGAILTLVVGLALSLLLGVLTYSFGVGQAHWRVLIDERNHELQFQALHDSLTGLPNRALIMDRIDQLLARNRRSGTSGAALYIDIDDFKIVNDSLGHETGDRLLVAIAARLSSTLRGADTIGRMGGDEFVVLIDGSDPMVAPELVAERLLDVMQEPFELEGSLTSLHANTSIGIAVGDRATGGELLRDADIALDKAKAEGKNRFEFFHPKMQSEIGRRIRLEYDLRSALAGDQFRLVYQPIYNLDDLSVVGVEALLRWVHPAEGLLSPDEFIPILEQTGQIREIGVWVLHEACRQMAVWHSRGDTLNLSVNISARQLDDDRIVEHIRHALHSSGLHPSSLIVEVTEGALDARRKGGVPADAGDQGHGCECGGRRLRHGLCLAGVPAAVPDRLHQDRQVVHERDRRLARIAHADPDPGPAREGSRPQDPR